MQIRLRRAQQLLALPQGFARPGSGQGMTIAVGDPTFIIKDAKQFGLYFQDDWKVSQRLTVNLGLRYDKDFDFIGGSDIANSRTFQELQAIAPFSPLAASLVAKKATDYSKGFSPRVGFAYDLNGHGNHIVRGGFGMYYDNTFQNIPLFMEQQANNTIFQTAFAHWTYAGSGSRHSRYSAAPIGTSSTIPCPRNSGGHRHALNPAQPAV